MHTNIYWISFTYDGENQGVVCTEEESSDAALKKVQRLFPDIKSDHEAIFEIYELESGMVVDKHYTTEDMNNLGYNSVKSTMVDGIGYIDLPDE